MEGIVRENLSKVEITYFFYGKMNGRYLVGNALSYFNALTAISHSVTMKQKYCELVLFCRLDYDKLACDLALK